MDRKIPNKERLSLIYSSYNTVFTEVLTKIEARLKDVIHLNSKPTYKTRIKSFGSYYKKILRQKNDQIGDDNPNFVTLTDMMGIRVICAFLEDLADVQNQICKNFDVKEIEKKGAEQSFREFGYESIHILVKIPEDCMPDTKQPVLPEDTVCEIQIRTILQDAWAEVEHELIYKSEFNPFDKPLRRKLASINASLTLADMIFQEIRDYQNKLQYEIGTRRNTFYEKADDLTSEVLLPGSSASKSSPSDSDEVKIDKNASIDDLVLSALHEHNIGNFSKAQVIYTRILESVPVPPPVVMGVIFKHRGMAYFAQGKYDEALSDFKQSILSDPKSFRSLYYEGIVYSIQNKHEEAIDCFNRSLEIDSYQSHVYYRRSLAYFNLGNYVEALKDIDNAEKLGLKDDDIVNLKKKIIEKFDMGM
ncbi:MULTISPECIES: tetratricopeptide repeat protein [Treponema]|jgi:ppGpp synthetase/RelA/SpoT-type nucleotidyltranferase|uniref:PpGpp synthetase/RelA/SpoT-type nucleotidyltransferase n=1 Tax=Treponema rectale TaxID=744512 RepID=A0A840SF00_9SPIR|nr:MULTISPECIES: tetratricopeptide repeat protein [Treponema]MBB5218133.1 ppGpp synthetase/RelA/SpoT-type nucleotidyltransferase [Treponema rectale]MBE6354627.1 tetratricopeptide repeat protein [Treponema sp.]QOS40157.1 tetratricopeptide repeat protein [Treponema rectale]